MSTPSLDQQINDYMLTASGHLDARKHGVNLKHLALYCAAAGSALTMLGQAEAAIVCNAGTPLPVELTGGVNGTHFDDASFLQFDMNGDAVNDFALFAYSTGAFPSNNGMAAASGGAYNSMIASSDLQKISSGFVIGPTLASGSWVNSVMDTGRDIVTSGGGLGPGWTGGIDEEGLVGVKFRIGANTHYGWIRLRSGGYNGGPAEIAAIEWAYEDTPDTPIRAGEGCDGAEAVPVPVSDSAWGLAALAMGAFGLAYLRKRREDGGQAV